MDKLPYGKARMLNYWKGRLTSHIPAYYDIDNYGKSIKTIANEFIEEGFLRISTPYENLDRALVADLKKFLKSIGEKVSGSKSELCQRIISSCTEEQIRQFFNKSEYVLTDNGQQQLDNNSLFFLNDRLNCGFTIMELKQLKDNNPYLSDVQILTIALKNKLPQDIQQKKWRNYSWHLKSLYTLQIENENYLQAISFLWLALHYNLSGLEEATFNDSGNYVKNFNHLYLDNNIVKYFDICIDNLSWDLEKFKDYVMENCFSETPDFPFHYYSKGFLLNVMCDKLMGNEYSPLTCTYPHYNPKENSKEYYYQAENREYVIDLSLKQN